MVQGDSQDIQQRRLHGLQLPLHPLQVGAVVTFCAISFINFGLSLPLIQQPSIFLTLLILEALLTGGNVAVFLLTSLMDTSDPAITRNESGHPLYCHICRSHVHSSSKHCQACNKCVIGFDHHCLWLNCCIGSSNYAAFIALLALSILLFSLHFAIALADLIATYTEPVKSLELLPLPVPLPAVRGLLAVVVVITTAALCLTGDLLLFHIILRAKCLTTYEYILAAKYTSEAAAGPHDGRGGGPAALLRLLPLCDSCAALRSAQQQRLPPPPRRAGVSVCRALGTTTEAGKQARERRLNRSKVAPLPVVDGARGHDHRSGAVAGGSPRADTLVRVSEVQHTTFPEPQASVQETHGQVVDGAPATRGPVQMVPLVESLAVAGAGESPVVSQVALDGVLQLQMMAGSPQNTLAEV